MMSHVVAEFKWAGKLTPEPIRFKRRRGQYHLRKQMESRTITTS